MTSAGRKRYNVDENGTKESAPKDRRLTERQKKAIKIGIAATATALAALGAYELNKHGKLDGLKKAGKQKLDEILGKKGNLFVTGLQSDNEPGRSTSAKKLFKKLPNRESVDEAIRAANPTKSHNNCYNCVVATIGRLCGYDVAAKGDTQGGKGFSFDNICRAFNLDPDNERDVKRVHSPTVERLISRISKSYSEGDTGAVAVEWNDLYKRRAGNLLSDSVAHTFNWLIRNGKVEFMDGQVALGASNLENYLRQYIDSGKEASFAKFANIVDGLSESDLERIKDFVN